MITIQSVQLDIKLRLAAWPLANVLLGGVTSDHGYKVLFLLLVKSEVTESQSTALHAYLCLIVQA